MRELIKLVSGYRDKRGKVKPGDAMTFWEMTIAEALLLTPGLRVWFLARDGTARLCKVNGKVRTWKRDALRVEIPVKYGMYEYATLKSLPDKGIMELLLVLVEEDPALPENTASES